MTAFPHPPYFSRFPLLKIEVKGCNFGTTEFMEADQHSVPIILTEHNCQNGKGTQKGKYAWKGNTPAVIVASKPKACF
jgi:hypothetical protein